MDPTDDVTALMQAQISQTMLEHQIVVQALRAQSLVSLLFVLVLGSLIFFLYRRHVCSSEALIEQTKRHCAEQRERDERHTSELNSMRKQHSLDLHSHTMQMLHAFEGMVSRKRADSGPSSRSG